MVINGVDDLCELFFEAAKTERKMPRAYDLRLGWGRRTVLR